MLFPRANLVSQYPPIIPNPRVIRIVKNCNNRQWMMSILIGFFFFNESLLVPQRCWFPCKVTILVAFLRVLFYVATVVEDYSGNSVSSLFDGKKRFPLYLCQNRREKEQLLEFAL